MEKLTFNKLGQWSIVKEEPNLNKALPLYLEYIEPLEKNEKLPHFLRFMGNHPKAEETATWASNLKHRNLAEFAMRHAKTKDEGLNNEEKSTVEHFNNSLHMPEVQRAAGSLNNKHNFENGTALLRGAEKQYTERHAKNAPKLAPMEGEKVMDLGNGIAVYNLPLDENNKNKNEATAMGHCATALHGGQLWSIRKDHGNGMCEPMVTISHVDGYTGEIKGKHNWKPSTDHHVNIAKMMASDLIKGHVGGGYMPESNFNFDDLEPKLREKLLNYKPSLTNSVYKEELPEPFQGSYNHEPEVKTLLKAKLSLEDQRKILGTQNHEALLALAANPNLHPEVQHILENMNDEYVDGVLARNPNLHPELQHKLLDIYGKGAPAHDILGENTNLPELQNKLFDMYDEDCRVYGVHDMHNTLAKNPNLHPELQRKLVDMYGSEKGSSIHRTLAQNPNLLPELQRKLLDIHDKDSMIHDNLAKNPKLHPEVQRRLAMHDKGPAVHGTLAYNPNLHSETQHRLFNMYKGELSDANMNDYAYFIRGLLAENPNLHPEVQHRLAGMHGDEKIDTILAANPNLHPEVQHILANRYDEGDDVNITLGRNRNLHPEVHKKINNFFSTPIQKLISILNNEKGEDLEKEKAMNEIRRRRREKYKQKISESASLSDLKHMAESIDHDISTGAVNELKRRGVSGYDFKPTESNKKT